MVLSGTTYMNL